MPKNTGVRVAFGLLALFFVFWIIGVISHVLWTIFVLGLVIFLVWFIWVRRRR